jgi:hypothetical protein
MRLLVPLLVAGLAWARMPWPHPPQDSVHPLGNSWGVFQDYGGTPYCHNGADIMVPALWPATACKAGYVKAIFLGGSPMYNGVVVGDSANAAFCEGYMYYHIDNSTIVVQVGDTIQVGDTLGLIATWSVARFHHNHFSKNHNSGTVWPSYGTFFRNPLTEMGPNNDSNMPVFLNAVTGQRFAVCRDNSSFYLNPDSVYGNVDLIARLEDKVNHRVWKVAIYKTTYSIRDTAGSHVVPETRSFEMIDSIESYVAGQCRTVYKDDATCNSNCGYDSLARRFYYIFTNTDGDSLIEYSDSLQSWQTGLVPDGPYWVKVTASDEYGNTAIDSMLVRVKNHPTGVTEQVGPRTAAGALLVIVQNPARASVELRVSGPGTIRLYDTKGQLVWQSMVAAPTGARLTWNGRTPDGHQAPAGVYLARFESAGFSSPPARLLYLK